MPSARRPRRRGRGQRLRRRVARAAPVVSGGGGSAAGGGGSTRDRRPAGHGSGGCAAASGARRARRCARRRRCRRCGGTFHLGFVFGPARPLPLCAGAQCCAVAADPAVILSPHRVAGPASCHREPTLVIPRRTRRAVSAQGPAAAPAAARARHRSPDPARAPRVRGRRRTARAGAADLRDQGLPRQRREQAFKDYLRNVAALMDQSNQESRSLFGLLAKPGTQSPVQLGTSVNTYRNDAQTLVDRAKRLEHPGRARQGAAVPGRHARVPPRRDHRGRAGAADRARRHEHRRGRRPHRRGDAGLPRERRDLQPARRCRT